MRPLGLTAGALLLSLVWAAPVLAADPAGASDEPSGLLGTLGEMVLRGGVLMLPIAFCSVLAVGIAIDRLLALRFGLIVPAELRGQVQRALEHGDLDGARKRTAEAQSPMGRMVHAGLLHWEDGFSDMSAALEDAGQREADDLNRHLPALQGIASVAPLLGLLGTVVGMIQSFFTVAKQQGALGNAELLAEGIGQALVTTAAGLSVAIPTLVLFYFFRGRIRRLVRELDNVSRTVMAVHRRSR